MSIHRRDAKRDLNEAPIVEALTAAGASVTRLSDKGVPDLLVGFAGRTRLLEVKAPKQVTHRRAGEGGLTEDQRGWWATWLGEPPMIVHTPEEALRAIGVQPVSKAEELPRATQEAS